MRTGWARRELLGGMMAAPAATSAGKVLSGFGNSSIGASWDSLARQFTIPDWFRDAKFGIWSHWGPQSVPEQGDWYGRFLYMQGHPQYQHHLETYGHPADTGMMEVQRRWTAECWEPEALMQRFVKAGARYFVSLACHHDNLDCYDSAYHQWNSLRVGPKRDVVGTWERVARQAGLRFGVSNHTSHAWHWYQPAYGYDPEGPRKGERYDAFRLTKADGKGKWWEGLDPRQLYTGRHMVVPDGIDSIAEMNAWHDAHDGQWIETAPPADPGFALQWLKRQQDLIEKYRPDFCYFDNYELPFGQTGLDALAHYYNASLDWHGDMQVVATAKKLGPQARMALTEDVERGFSDRLREQVWQTDTCLGDWFYNRDRYEKRSYVGAKAVLQRLADVVSKNGNLLLSVPQRGDGSIDSEEEAILDQLAAWMAVNGEAIFASRPWHIYGEGATVLPEGMQNEGAFSGFAAGDIRFTVKGGALYLLLLDPEPGALSVQALGTARFQGRIERATLLGGGEVPFLASRDALRLELPPARGNVPVIRLEGNGIEAGYP